MTLELFIGPIDLSPYLYGQNKLISNAKLTGLSAEMEQDLWRLLHNESAYESRLDFYRYGQIYLIRTGQPVMLIGSARYDSGGRCRLNILFRGRRNYFFLLNQDNEWWTKANPQRKALKKRARLF